MHALPAVTPQELQERTMAFAVAVYRFVRPWFRTAETRHVAAQLLRSSTSVAANYRAACLARSSAEWLAKMGLVREESDESQFWLEFTQRAGIAGDADGLRLLACEARELARIFAAAYRRGRANQRSSDLQGGSSRRWPPLDAPDV
jgi:four helix bundle protein